MAYPVIINVVIANTARFAAFGIAGFIIWSGSPIWYRVVLITFIASGAAMIGLESLTNDDNIRDTNPLIILPFVLSGFAFVFSLFAFLGGTAYLIFCVVHEGADTIVAYHQGSKQSKAEGEPDLAKVLETENETTEK